MTPLTLAYSPCPNDTFIFTPWVEGHIAGAPPVIERLDDIDVLNAAALAGEPDIVKVSFHAYGHLRDRYCLLRSGGALGRGCGPLVVARPGLTREALPARTVAIPGPLTTAALCSSGPSCSSGALGSSGALCSSGELCPAVPFSWSRWNPSATAMVQASAAALAAT